MNRARFTALWERCLVHRCRVSPQRVYETVLGRYSEPHRHYHTPEHIEHCLRQHDLAADRMTEPDAVEMAIWFHDVVYDVPTDGNERRSAELFLELAQGSVAPDFARSVYDMILSTRHPHVPSGNDDRFLVDVDLSSFGLPWEQMRKDSDNVRKEFALVSDEAFYPAHICFMRSLLERPEFFVTEFFRSRYEAQARSNVGRLLDELKRAGFD